MAKKDIVKEIGDSTLSEYGLPSKRKEEPEPLPLYEPAHRWNSGDWTFDDPLFEDDDGEDRFDWGKPKTTKWYTPARDWFGSGNTTDADLLRRFREPMYVYVGWSESFGRREYNYEATNDLQTLTLEVHPDRVARLGKLDKRSVGVDEKRDWNRTMEIMNEILEEMDQGE